MPNLETIVAGVDFSEASHGALTWAAHHFAPRARFVVVHALELPVPPSFLGETSDQHVIAEELRKSILADTEALEKQSPGTEFTEEVPFGKAYEELARVAEREAADLILVGPHGERGGIQGLLGSTAERLLAFARGPVLLAAGTRDAPPARILMAVDDSPVRHKVIAWTRMLAGRFGASVTALHCLDQRLFGRMRMVSGSSRMEKLETSARADTDRWIRSLLQEAGLPAEDENVDVRVGPPGQVISEAACDGYDLMVLGSRGEGTTQRIFLGSTAKRVIRKACVPALMVPRD